MAASDMIDQSLRIDVPVSPCRSAVDHLGWTTTVAVGAGPYVLGLRANNHRTESLLHAAVTPRLVGVGAVAPNLSVVLAAPSAPGETQEMHRLYLGHHLAVRSRDPRRVVDGLGAYLDAHSRTFQTDRALVLCTAVVRGGRAHLVDHNTRPTVISHERRWRNDGFQIVDRPWVDVDLATGELVLPEIEPLSSRVTDWSGAWLPADEDATVPSGRYPIATWSPRRGAGSGGHRLLAASRSVVNLAELDSGRALPALRDLLAAVTEVKVVADVDQSRPLMLSI